VKIGVLALQGAFARHARAVEQLGAASIEVRVPADLDDIDALILPGGESTTMSKLLESQQLFDPVAERLGTGMPVFGTCAGMILLASEIVDGRADQQCFGAIDIVAHRNAYGRQVDSFEVELDVDGLDDPFHAVFIRAPGVDRVGPGVQVLAEVDGAPVLCASGSVMVASFHPELTDDLRLHELFLKSLGGK
jgi:pyridoxal 5'-phosphate synthase pdxT subunit